MAKNDLKLFAGGSSANVMTQAEYEAFQSLVNGFSTGVAQSKQLNKVWRQSSFSAAMIGLFTSLNANEDVLDDGNVDAFAEKFARAIKEVVNLRMSQKSAWQPVISLTITVPPASPAIGDAYIVPSGAIGVWAGLSQKLAEWNGTSWNIITTKDGHGVSLPDGRVFERVSGTYIEKLALDAQSGKWNFVIATGSANVVAAALSPAPTAYTDGMMVLINIGTTSTTTTPTLNLNGLGAKTIVNSDGSALMVGALVAGAKQLFAYDGSLNKFILLTPANTGVKTGGGWIRHSDGTYEAWGQVAFPGTTLQIDVTLPITFPTSIDSVLVTDTGGGVYPGAGQSISNSQLRCFVQPFIINPSTGSVVAKNTHIILYYRVWGK